MGVGQLHGQVYGPSSASGPRSMLASRRWYVLEARVEPQLPSSTSSPAYCPALTDDGVHNPPARGLVLLHAHVFLLGVRPRRAGVERVASSNAPRRLTKGGPRSRHRGLHPRHGPKHSVLCTPNHREGTVKHRPVYAAPTATSTPPPPPLGLIVGQVKKDDPEHAHNTTNTPTRTRSTPYWSGGSGSVGAAAAQGVTSRARGDMNRDLTCDRTCSRRVRGAQRDPTSRCQTATSM